MVGSRKLQRAPPVSYQPSPPKPPQTKRSSLPVILPRRVRPHEADRHQPIRSTRPQDGAPVPAGAAVRVAYAAATAPVPAWAAAAAAAPAVVAPPASPAADAPVMAARSNHPNNAADQSRFPRPVRMPPPPPITPGSYAQFDNSPVRPTSSSSNGSSASTVTRSSFGMRSPVSPVSNRTSFESWDSSPRRPDYGWQRPAPIKQQRKRAAPGELFAALPGEVLELITRELRDSHLAPNSISCATCMMRDLCSVATAAKKLLHPARVVLYENIQLVGGDSQAQKKRYKISTGSRLILLRRTLRSNDELAAMVRCLKAPAMPPGIGYDDYQNLIASVIMACPNFERLAGPVSHYDHSFNRLFHALSTRSNLKEMNWVLAPPPPPPATRQRLNRSSSSVAAMMGGSDLRSPTSPTTPMSPMSPMTPNSPASFFDLPSYQSAVFLDLHANWSQLKTLSVHCLPGSSLFMHSLVEKAGTLMPNLEHVYLSHLPATAFNDSSLLALPALKTLSLSHVPGITCAGLSSFATRQSAQSLQKLTLKHMELDSLPALARIFLNLTSLHTFSFVQATTPTMPEDEMIWLFPYLAAPSLRMLHWDITNHTDAAHKAETILAKSIRAGGFPALRALRAPNDTEGVFQSLCRPYEKIELPSDKYWGRGLIKLSSNNSQTDTSASKGSDKPTSADSEGPTRDYTDLHQSRLAAQTRLDNARSTPRFFVNVIDEDGTALEKYGMAGFMGEIGSPIHYILKPDPGATDEHGGLVDMSDFLGVGAEDVTEREGCTGRWNTGNQIMADKKERERWWHTERGRWRGVTPS